MYLALDADAVTDDARTFHLEGNIAFAGRPERTDRLRDVRVVFERDDGTVLREVSVGDVQYVGRYYPTPVANVSVTTTRRPDVAYPSVARFESDAELVIDNCLRFEPNETWQVASKPMDDW